MTLWFRFDSQDLIRCINNVFKLTEGQLPKGAAYLETPKLGERSGNRLGQPPPPQQLYRSPYEPGRCSPLVVFVFYVNKNRREIGDCYDIVWAGLFVCWLAQSVYTIQREYCVPSSATTSSGALVPPANGDENSQQPTASQPSQETRKFVDLTANKFSGVGPVSNEGVPIALRSVSSVGFVF